jgi:hypothetical protein
VISSWHCLWQTEHVEIWSKTPKWREQPDSNQRLMYLAPLKFAD